MLELTDLCYTRATRYTLLMKILKIFQSSSHRDRGKISEREEKKMEIQMSSKLPAKINVMVR